MPDDRSTRLEPRPALPRIVGALLLQVSVVVMLGVAYAWTRRHNIPFHILTRDVVAQTDLPYFAGYLSHLGAMLWCAAAAVCLFCYLVIRGRMDKRWAGFFLWAGAISALLSADDMFQLHEELLPRELKVGERIIFSIYALLIVLLLVRYVRLLPQTHLPLLVIAFACFAFSLSVDLGLLALSENNRHLFEDGSKLAGIANWCAYFIHAGWSRLSAVPMKPS